MGKSSVLNVDNDYFQEKLFFDDFNDKSFVPQELTPEEACNVSVIDGTEWIYKESSLVKSAQELTLYESRILAVVLAMMKPDDSPAKPYLFLLSDFAAYFGISEKISTWMRKTLLKLRQRSFVIGRPGERQRITGWIAWADLVENQNTVAIWLDPRVRPYLLGIKKELGYTKYMLENCKHLNSPYSYRFYERFKLELQQQNKTYIVMTLEEIIEWFKLGKSYYHYGSLKKYIINNAIEDVNKTDISVHDIVELKKGRKVVALRFEIWRKINFIPEPFGQSGVDLDFSAIEHLKPILAEWNITFDNLRYLAEQHPSRAKDLIRPDYIEQVLNDIDKRYTQNGRETTSGLIIDGLIKGYGEKTSAQKIREQKKADQLKLKQEKAIAKALFKDFIAELNEKVKDLRLGLYYNDLENLKDEFLSTLNIEISEKFRKNPKSVTYRTLFNTWLRERLLPPEELDFKAWAERKGIIVEKCDEDEWLIKGS